MDTTQKILNSPELMASIKRAEKDMKEGRILTQEEVFGKTIITPEKEISRKDMLDCFDGMCLFLAIHGWVKEDERAVAIRKLIEDKI